MAYFCISFSNSLPYLLQIRLCYQFVAIVKSITINILSVEIKSLCRCEFIAITVDSYGLIKTSLFNFAIYHMAEKIITSDWRGAGQFIGNF
jgi:hypothetical protein